MDISPATNAVIQSGQVQPQRLDPPVKAGQAVDPELVGATRQFEAIFVQQFLGQALKPVLHETPESKGPGSGIYHYMMTEVISNALAEQEVFGVSSALQVELSPDQSGKSPIREGSLNTVTTGNKQ